MEMPGEKVVCFFSREGQMKNFGLHLFLLVGLCQISLAALPYGVDPEVDVSLDVEEVFLPDAVPMGDYEGEIQLNAIIEAGSAHSIGFSFDGFASETTQESYSDNMSMCVNGKTLLEPGEMQVLYGSNGPTPLGGAQLPLTIKYCIGEVSRFSAGRYRCVTSLIVMALPE